MVGVHRIPAAGDAFSGARQKQDDTLDAQYSGFERLYGCDDCGRVLLRKKLIEVDPERHDDMRVFNSWRICRSCACRGNVEF